ncbi:hypothetical protein ONZ45_g3341 [Pleurotus djamor]|nr:hypothetical protein ONZ45_g3341 [Pleurotus djamor]
MRTQLFVTAVLAASTSVIARPLEQSSSILPVPSSVRPSILPAATAQPVAVSNAAENPQLKAIADAPRVEESTGSKMYNPASDPEAEVIAEAGLMDAFETAYRAIKAFLRKLKPQVKIPGYTHYVG